MPAPKKEVKASGTQKVRVARGRTVNFEGKAYSNGAFVTLPTDEVTRLRSLGFLTDPNGDRVVSESVPALRNDPLANEPDGE